MRKIQTIVSPMMSDTGKVHYEYVGTTVSVPHVLSRVLCQAYHTDKGYLIFGRDRLYHLLSHDMRKFLSRFMSEKQAISRGYLDYGVSLEMMPKTATTIDMVVLYHDQERLLSGGNIYMGPRGRLISHGDKPIGITMSEHDEDGFVSVGLISSSITNMDKDEKTVVGNVFEGVDK